MTEHDNTVDDAQAEDILAAIRKRRRDREDMIVHAILNGPGANFDLTEEQEVLLIADEKLRQIVNLNIIASLTLDANNPDKSVIQDLIGLDDEAQERIKELID